MSTEYIKALLDSQDANITSKLLLSSFRYYFQNEENPIIRDLILTGGYSEEDISSLDSHVLASYAACLQLLHWDDLDPSEQTTSNLKQLLSDYISVK